MMNPNDQGAIVSILLILSRWMRELELVLKEHGTESDAYYRFLATAQDMESLIDSIPGARLTILEHIDG